MASAKRLNSVCHSIAHHAVSGLSYVHPHVLATCRSAGLEEMTVDLLDAEPCPPRFRGVEPLRLSLRGLREKLESILTTEGFSLSDLAVAELTFRRDSQFHDDYSSICCVKLVSKAGRIYEHRVDYVGRSIAI
jgi:hypothetical protein